jgi:hypothetical protein
MRVRMVCFKFCIHAASLLQNYAAGMPATMHDQPFFKAAIAPPRWVELDHQQACQKRCSVKEMVS